MPNPRGMFPAWEPDSFTQAADQVLDCGFSSPQNQVVFEPWPGKQKSLAVLQGQLHHLLLELSIFQLCLNTILALSQDSLFQM